MNLKNITAEQKNKILTLISQLITSRGTGGSINLGTLYQEIQPWLAAALDLTSTTEATSIQMGNFKRFIELSLYHYFDITYDQATPNDKYVRIKNFQQSIPTTPAPACITYPTMPHIDFPVTPPTEPNPLVKDQHQPTWQVTRFFKQSTSSRYYTPPTINLYTLLNDDPNSFLTRLIATGKNRIISCLQAQKLDNDQTIEILLLQQIGLTSEERATIKTLLGGIYYFIQHGVTINFNLSKLEGLPSVQQQSITPSKIKEIFKNYYKLFAPFHLVDNANNISRITFNPLTNNNGYLILLNIFKKVCDDIGLQIFIKHIVTVMEKHKNIITVNQLMDSLQTPSSAAVALLSKNSLIATNYTHFGNLIRTLKKEPLLGLSQIADSNDHTVTYKSNEQKQFAQSKVKTFLPDEIAIKTIDWLENVINKLKYFMEQERLFEGILKILRNGFKDKNQIPETIPILDLRKYILENFVFYRENTSIILQNNTTFIEWLKKNILCSSCFEIKISETDILMINLSTEQLTTNNLAAIRAKYYQQILEEISIIPDCVSSIDQPPDQLTQHASPASLYLTSYPHLLDKPLEKQPAITEIITSEDGQKVFSRHAISSDEDCIYTVFGITKQQAYDLIKDNLDDVKEILQSAVKEALKSRVFINYIEQQIVPNLPSAFRLYQSSVISLESDSDRYLAPYVNDLVILNKYLEYYVHQKGCSDLEILQALAKIRQTKLSIYCSIKDQKDKVDTIAPYVTNDATADYPQQVHLLFMAGNRFCRLKLEHQLTSSLEPCTNSNNTVHNGANNGMVSYSSSTARYPL